MQLIRMNADRLYRALAAVDITRGTDKSRPILNTVYFDTEHDGTLTLVSTDSYRLGKADLMVADEDKVEGESFMLGGDLKSLLTALKSASGASVELKVERPSVEVRLPSATLTLEYGEGTFPDYRQLIPATPQVQNETVGYNPAYLVDAGKAAMVFSGQTPKRCTVPVRLSHDGATRPGTFTIDNGNDTFAYLLMPVRLSSYGG